MNVGFTRYIDGLGLKLPLDNLSDKGVGFLLRTPNTSSPVMSSSHISLSFIWNFSNLTVVEVCNLCFEVVDLQIGEDGSLRRLFKAVNLYLQMREREREIRISKTSKVMMNGGAVQTTSSRQKAMIVSWRRWQWNTPCSRKKNGEKDKQRRRKENDE